MKKIALVFIVVMISIIVCCFFSGCNAIKQIRQDNAFNRVITDSVLSERTYRQLEISHPCIVHDSTFRLIPGQAFTQYDTTLLSDTAVVKDTVYLTKYINTVKKITIVDTLKVSVEDVRAVNLANQELSEQKGQVTILKAQLAAATSKGNSWFWWFIGACVFGLISDFVLIYFKI